MKMRSLLSHTTVLLAGVVLAGAATVAFAWTSPQNTPPNCVAGQTGCDAPLNVGTGSQVKNGNLSVNSFAATQNSVFYNSLGIGSSNAPTYTLDVTGTQRVTGSVTAQGYFHSSDASLKANVRTSPGLELVKKLRGVTFDWKKDGSPSAGVIAQEVETVMPSAVKTDPQTGLKSVEYDQLIAPMIEAIKQQEAKIDAQTVEINSLRDEVQKLEAATQD